MVREEPKKEQGPGRARRVYGVLHDWKEFVREGAKKEQEARQGPSHLLSKHQVTYILLKHGNNQGLVLRGCNTLLYNVLY